ncbi:caveolae-associated protein 4a [Hippocampus zosterae]|uniref:caveolae-associated protein 4a n=1 Tax=Hippocampus zosterae TaxID=109293 RepID=UPI00223D9CF8|nr:caveolae-associated protein 4a [Hippocampus zosterae]
MPLESLQEMDQHKYGAQEKLEIVGLEDEEGKPISALSILSLLERVAGIIDNVQSGQQRMEERQLDLENNIHSIQGDVLKLAKEHAETSGCLDKLLQKTRKVSANVKDVRARVEKQNGRVKKVESTQDELLTRNKFRVVIYQGETEVPSVAVTKSPKGGLEALELEPDSYDVPADLSSDEEYLSMEEADPSRATRFKKSMVKSTETLKAAFSKENMSKTKDNIGTKFHNLGEKVMPPERREKMHQAGERIKQSGERFKENIAKKAPTKESFKIKIKKERAVAEGQEGADADVAAEAEVAAVSQPQPEPASTKVVAETKREGLVEQANAPGRAEQEEDYGN